METAWIQEGKKTWEEEKNEMSLPRKVKDFLQWMEEKQGFRPFRLEDRAMVDQYSRESVFFDLSFTNFWAWEEVFHYYWKMVGDTLAVVYITLEQVPAVILMPGPSRRLEAAVHVLRELFGRWGYSLICEYIPEEWLPLYKGLGVPTEVSTHRDWSDYVYDVADFTLLEGVANKSRRRELKLVEGIDGVHFEPLRQELFHPMLQVFDRWCQDRDCKDCFYGCERQAFARLENIWEEGRYYGGLVYIEEEPMAFALGETLGNCACYSFQKNAVNLRGLTYYISYRCVLLPGHPPQLNWCEDMGLAGLRENKLHYRPSRLVDKYTVTIRP